MYIKAALLILASASVVMAQDVPPTPLDSNTVMSAEQAAVRIALDSSFIRAGTAIALNPLMIPVGATSRVEPVVELPLRPVTRTDKLAAFLKASTQERAKVISCASSTSMGPRCDVVGADAYVSASNPRFDGGLATVTVTIEAQGTRGSLAYETMNIVMANTNNGWKVMKFERLGRS
jgi:hypothetical protein